MCIVTSLFSINVLSLSFYIEMMGMSQALSSLYTAAFETQLKIICQFAKVI